MTFVDRKGKDAQHSWVAHWAKASSACKLGWHLLMCACMFCVLTASCCISSDTSSGLKQTLAQAGFACRC